MQKKLLEIFFVTLEFTHHLSKKIRYVQINDSGQLASVLLLGNIGNGKSTICNKLSGEKDAFKAKISVKSVSMGLETKEFPQQGIRIIDSQGLGDPQNTDLDLLKKLVLNIQNPGLSHQILTQGLSTIVVPIMVEKSCRITLQTIRILFHVIHIF